ncbi:unnamed protein product [Symbiodinium sp. CCMP2592]|nr:unnamed protein product [Symbiodinium sp. CCMP2592]
MAVPLTESKAVFLERCETAGLPKPIRDILVGKNLSTLAGLAFAAGQPGETPSDAVLTGLARSGTEEVPIATLASLRRLVFEAQLLMTAQVKMLIEHRADDQKAELAPAERSERIQKQSERLAGVALRNESECSYGSYDLVMKMVQENCVSYLSPARFPSRQAELRLEKPRKELDVVNSKITLKDQAVDLQCQLHTPLCLHHALHRRALAMDLVGVASYSVSMEFHEYLMSHLTMEPPPGYHQVTLHQVLAADRAAWLRLAEKLPKGLRAGPDGKLPLDIELPKLQGDPKVAFHLLPLGPSASSSGKRSMDGDQGQNNDSKIQRTGGKGKGKGKTKTKAFPKSMPVSLKDKWSRTKRGVPICWAFNTEEGCYQWVNFSERRLGLNDSIGVDKNVGRCLIAPVLRLDLGDEQARELVVQMLENPNCAYVHVSPPALNQKHRSLKHRDGADASCYSASCNLLYEFCGKLFSMCWSKGILFSCENPGQSELWRTPQWCKHTLCLNSIDTVFHMCMWGSLSPRFTRIVHSVPSLTQLGVRCCGVSSSHTHESRNALHDSTFPLDLSRAWANAIVEQLVALGALPRARSLDESRAPLHREAQVAAASQPTRKKVPPLVSEFRCVATIDTPKPFLDTASKKLEGPIPIPAGAKCDTTLTVLPAGSRVIRRQLLGVSSPALKLDVGSETSNPTSGRVASFPEVSKPKPDRVQVCSEATHPAEAFAASCLKLGYIDPGKISEFTQLLESELPARGDGGQHEFSFTVGSFVHGGIYGLRTSSVNFPLTTQVLARFMRQQCPDAVFTSLALMRDVQTTLHIDTNNSLPYLNTVAKVTNFEEGGLWVHNDHGDMPCPDANFGQLMGTKVDFENGVIRFDSHLKHCTLPWVKGRLWYEASTTAMGELKQKVERSDSAEPIRLAVAERTTRIEEQRRRLNGVHFSSDSEPSYRVTDLVFQQGTDQQLIWLPWEKYTSRAQEIVSSKSDLSISFDNSGNLRLNKKFQDAQCSLTGELQVRQALQRRSLCYDLAQLCAYSVMEAYHEEMFSLLSRPPVPGRMCITMGQVKEADKVLFLKIAEETRGALSVRPDGSKPMELQLLALKAQPQVQFCVIPGAASPATPYRVEPYETWIPGGKGFKGKKGKTGKGKDGKGKTRGKQNQGSEVPQPPPAYVICAARWLFQQRSRRCSDFCFPYNKDGCKFAKDKRCRRGKHICWKCFKPHSYTACTKGGA